MSGPSLWRASATLALARALAPKQRCYTDFITWKRCCGFIPAGR